MSLHGAANPHTTVERINLGSAEVCKHCYSACIELLLQLIEGKMKMPAQANPTLAICTDLTGKVQTDFKTWRTSLSLS